MQRVIALHEEEFRSHRILNQESNINEQLMQAVTFHRVAEVKQLLERGADANYESSEYKQYSDWSAQPYSPLRLVVFCISDSLLEDDGLRDFKEIAKLLIQHGAHTKPAMQLAQSRYGKYNPAGERNLFLEVLDVIAIADMHDGA